VARNDPPLSRTRPAGELGPDQCAAIDCVRERAPHAYVAQRSRFHVQPEIRRADPRGTLHAESLVILEQRQQQRRNGIQCQVARPRQHAQRAGVVVANHEHVHVGV
jgi:hypothetical protein